MTYDGNCSINVCCLQAKKYCMVSSLPSTSQFIKFPRISPTCPQAGNLFSNMTCAFDAGLWSFGCKKRRRVWGVQGTFLSRNSETIRLLDCSSLSGRSSNCRGLQFFVASSVSSLISRMIPSCSAVNHLWRIRSLQIPMTRSHPRATQSLPQKVAWPQDRTSEKVLSPEACCRRSGEYGPLLCCRSLESQAKEGTTDFSQELSRLSSEQWQGSSRQRTKAWKYMCTGWSCSTEWFPTSVDYCTREFPIDSKRQRLSCLFWLEFKICPSFGSPVFLGKSQGQCNWVPLQAQD